MKILECLLIICIEYNSKFPPNIEISVDEKFDQKWAHDDYMGASLSFITKCMEEKNYKLISTNITGSNSFFVEATGWLKNILDGPTLICLTFLPVLFKTSFDRYLFDANKLLS